MSKIVWRLSKKITANQSLKLEVDFWTKQNEVNTAYSMLHLVSLAEVFKYIYALPKYCSLNETRMCYEQKCGSKEGLDKIFSNKNKKASKIRQKCLFW